MVERSWIVIPAYNEARVIEETLRRMRSFLPFVVVVDDGSTDDTADLARGGGATVLRHANNLGAGRAFRTGLAYALKQGATHVCTFDAAGRHDPATIESMLATMRERNVAVVLGSRYLNDANDAPFLRRLARRGAVGISYARTKLPLTDVRNDARVFTRRAAETILAGTGDRGRSIDVLRTLARVKLAYTEVSTVVAEPAAAKVALSLWPSEAVQPAS